jgi:hypothetical protein
MEAPRGDPMRERGAPAPPVLVACRDVDAGHIRVFGSSAKTLELD